MPRIFLYEHLTATGNGHDPLYREGLAMRDAIAADFRTNEDYEVAFFKGGDETAFEAQCRAADFTLIIAPEFDGILANLTSIAERTSTCNLGSQHRGVVLCADKLALSRHWQTHGIPTPPTASPLTGPLPASPGIGIGPVRQLTATPLEIDKGAIGDPTSSRSWFAAPQMRAARSESERPAITAANPSNEIAMPRRSPNSRPIVTLSAKSD